jgi:hypothetical protein
MTIRQFQNLPQPGVFRSLSDVATYTRLLRDALFKARRGKLECVVELTLTESAASTVLTDERISNQTVILFDPLTANAAAELAAGTMYVLAANRLTGQATITHANNAQTDRSYLVALIG